MSWFLVVDKDKVRWQSGFSGGDVATAATVNVVGEWWERKRRRENKKFWMLRMNVFW